MATLNSRRLLLLRIDFAAKNEFQNTKKRLCIRRVYAERQQKGKFHLLVKDLILFDQEHFFQCFRMLGQDTSFKNKQQKCESQLVQEKGFAFTCDICNR